MTITVSTTQEIPTELTTEESYYWMGDHIEVGPAFLDITDVGPYVNKHSFCPTELFDSSIESPFGYFEIKIGEVTKEPYPEFNRLDIERVNSEFKATLLLLGVQIDG